MKCALLWLFPRDWRDRYSDEITEFLEHSRHPLSDTSDMAWCAGLMRLEQMTAKETLMHILRVFSIVLIALGIVGVGRAVSELAHGWAEIPLHWWSSAAIAPLLLGAALAAVFWWPRVRRD